MKKIIGLSLCAISMVASARESNVVVAKNQSQFHSLLECATFHCDSLVVVMCYASDQMPRCCSNRRKLFGNDAYINMHKIMRAVGRLHPWVIFVELDVSASHMKPLIDELDVSACQPECILFKNGEQVPGGRREIDLCNLTESSLHYFVSKYFDASEPRCNCKEIILVRDFAKEPYQGYSLWDWGYTFYPNSLWPYAGPYYPMFVGAVE